MDEVMDRVVETQLKILYNTICNRSFVFLVTGNLVYQCEFVCRQGWKSGFRSGSKVKTTWSGKLNDSCTTAIYIYYKLEEGIVGVDGTSNQAVNR